MSTVGGVNEVSLSAARNRGAAFPVAKRAGLSGTAFSADSWVCGTISPAGNGLNVATFSTPRGLGDGPFCVACRVDAAAPSTN